MHEQSRAEQTKEKRRGEERRNSQRREGEWVIENVMLIRYECATTSARLLVSGPVLCGCEPSLTMSEANRVGVGDGVTQEEQRPVEADADMYNSISMQITHTGHRVNAHTSGNSLSRVPTE